ncbi:hypothetical protein, partial [Nostoc sp. 'Peltigera malacea cyanobiont' DB3992]|uniref:hypothetical protein n=1 Tax=Nostoc sp. 'Peltigera malacea cyanobiont' DB3992 TaxID=1206980 RepID=UPI00211EEE6E
MAFGFQSTFGILIDLGFSGTIIALVGDRIYDKKVVGSYIYAGKHFRNLLFWSLNTHKYNCFSFSHCEISLDLDNSITSFEFYCDFVIFSGMGILLCSTSTNAQAATGVLPSPNSQCRRSINYQFWFLYNFCL